AARVQLEGALVVAMGHARLSDRVRQLPDRGIPVRSLKAFATGSFDLARDDGLLRQRSRGARIANPDFLQEWLHRLFAAQKFLNRIVDIPRIAHGVNFVAQSNSGLLIKVPIRRTFKNGSHVCDDGIGPGVPVLAGIVAAELSAVRNEGSA